MTTENGDAMGITNPENGSGTATESKGKGKAAATEQYDDTSMAEDDEDDDDDDDAVDPDEVSFPARSRRAPRRVHGVLFTAMLTLSVQEPEPGMSTTRRALQRAAPPHPRVAY